MLTKTKITLVAVLVLGSASGAFAMDPDGFDVDIFRPAATASVPSQTKNLNAFAQVPPHIAKLPTAGAVRPLSTGERTWMDRASASFW